jgi:hypothetical protein
MDRMVQSRLPLRAVDIAVSLLVALDCLMINALVVEHAPALKLGSVGPLAVAYHDKQPHPLAIAVVVVVSLLGSLLRGVGRIAVFVFVGSAAANLASPTIWGDGVPDYIVVRRLDVILNLPDILIICAGTLIIATLAPKLARARR